MANITEDYGAPYRPDDLRNKKNPIGGEILQCRISGSAGNVIGCASDVMKNFIVSQFPKEFFKYVHVDTKLGTFDIESDDLNLQKKKPILVVSPKLQMTDDTNFQYLPDWSSTALYTYMNLDKYYASIIKDDYNKIYLYGVPDRLRITFDFTIVTDTKMSQYNIAHHLKHTIHQKGYTKIYPVIEGEIPKYIIHAMAKTMGYDMHTEEGIDKLVYYLNNRTSFYSMRKTNLASGRSIYTFAFKPTFVIENPDFPDLDDGEETGQMKENFRINFSLNVEFWVPMSFIMETKNKISYDNLEKEYPEIVDYLNDDVITLHHTTRFAPVSDLEDKKLYIWEAYITDDTTVEDIMDISSTLPREFKEVANYLFNLKTGDSKYIASFKLENNLSVVPIIQDLRVMVQPQYKDTARFYEIYSKNQSLMDEPRSVDLKFRNVASLFDSDDLYIHFFKNKDDEKPLYVTKFHLPEFTHDDLFLIKLFKNSSELKENEDFVMDWYNNEIHLIHPFPESTYHFAVYVQMNKFKALLDEVRKVKKKNEKDNNNI